jgi:hypothetical protein
MCVGWLFISTCVYVLPFSWRRSLVDDIISPPSWFSSFVNYVLIPFGIGYVFLRSFWGRVIRVYNYFIDKLTQFSKTNTYGWTRWYFMYTASGQVVTIFVTVWFMLALALLVRKVQLGQAPWQTKKSGKRASEGFGVTEANFITQLLSGCLGILSIMLTLTGFAVCMEYADKALKLVSFSVLIQNLYNKIVLSANPTHPGLGSFSDKSHKLEVPPHPKSKYDVEDSSLDPPTEEDKAFIEREEYLDSLAGDSDCASVDMSLLDKAKLDGIIMATDTTFDVNSASYYKMAVHYFNKAKNWVKTHKVACGSVVLLVIAFLFCVRKIRQLSKGKCVTAIPRPDHKGFVRDSKKEGFIHSVLSTDDSVVSTFIFTPNNAEMGPMMMDVSEDYSNIHPVYLDDLGGNFVVYVNNEQVPFSSLFAEPDIGIVQDVAVTLVSIDDESLLVDHNVAYSGRISSISYVYIPEGVNRKGGKGHKTSRKAGYYQDRKGKWLEYDDEGNAYDIDDNEALYYLGEYGDGAIDYDSAVSKIFGYRGGDIEDRGMALISRWEIDEMRKMDLERDQESFSVKNFDHHLIRNKSVLDQPALDGIKDHSKNCLRCNKLKERLAILRSQNKVVPPVVAKNNEKSEVVPSDVKSGKKKLTQGQRRKIKVQKNMVQVDQWKDRGEKLVQEVKQVVKMPEAINSQLPALDPGAYAKSIIRVFVLHGGSYKFQGNAFAISNYLVSPYHVVGQQAFYLDGEKYCEFEILYANVPSDYVLMKKPAGMNLKSLKLDGGDSNLCYVIGFSSESGGYKISVGPCFPKTSQHGATTVAGSSGSIVLDQHLRLIGMHQNGSTAKGEVRNEFLRIQPTIFDPVEMKKSNTKHESSSLSGAIPSNDIRSGDRD